MAVHSRVWQDWAQALWKRVLAFNDGSCPPPAEQPDLVDYDENFIVIRDAYPKGLIHWLVLPRKEMVEEIGHLNASHVELLTLMVQKAKDLEPKARLELGDEEAQFLRGFHSMPSMKLLHLHVISAELQGPRLNTPSHWASFTTTFFIPVDTMLLRLQETGKTQIDLNLERKLKKSTPTCPICKTTFRNNNEGVVDAKAHYKTCYQQQRQTLHANL